MPGFRRPRVERLIMEVVSGLIIRGEIKDPRVSSLVSITDVSVSKDLNYADIGVSGYLSDEEVDLAVSGLNSAAGFIQAALSRDMKTRNTPKLRFKVNRGIREGFEMARKLEDLVEHDDRNGS